MSKKEWQKNNTFLGIILDKVLLGGVAGVLLLIAQYYFEENLRQSTIRMSVSRVVTEALIQQKQSLRDAFSEYILLIDKIVREPGVSVEEKEDDIKRKTTGDRSKLYTRLSDLERQMKLAIELISVVSNSEKVDQHAKVLKENINNLGFSLRGLSGSGLEAKEKESTTDVETINNYIKKCLSSYVVFSGDIREVTVRAVELETK